MCNVRSGHKFFFVTSATPSFGVLKFASLGFWERRVTPTSFSCSILNFMSWDCKRPKSERGRHIVAISNRSSVFCWSVLIERSSGFLHLVIKSANSCKLHVSNSCNSGTCMLDLRLVLENSRINGFWDTVNCCGRSTLYIEFMTDPITFRYWSDRWLCSTRNFNTVFGSYALGSSWLLWHQLAKTRHSYPYDLLVLGRIC